MSTLLAPPYEPDAEADDLDDLDDLDDRVLVARARGDDQSAWDVLVRRYQPLVDSVVRRYRLSPADAADASQTVWVQVVRDVDKLREPRALAGWISTTTARVCLKALSSQRRTLPFDPQGAAETGSPARGSGCSSEPDPDETLVRAEARTAVQRALAELTPHQRELLLLVVADPPVSYQQISRRLGIPVGSIGPTRARCLKKLKDSSWVRQLLDLPLGAGRPTAA